MCRRISNDGIPGDALWDNLIKEDIRGVDDRPTTRNVAVLLNKCIISIVAESNKIFMEYLFFIIPHAAWVAFDWLDEHKSYL